jgi:thioredoxin-like negative regulator of GroEL
MKPLGIVVALIALAVVVGSIIFSKKQGSALDNDVAAADADDLAADAAQAKLVMSGDRNAILSQAIDIWVSDLGHEDHDLRDRLLEVKNGLQSTGS